MKIVKAWLWTTACLCLPASLPPISALEVLIYSDQGQSFVLQFEPEDSLASGIESIRQQLDSFVESDGPLTCGHEETLVVNLSGLDNPCLAKGALHKKGGTRDYKATLKDSEREDIGYVVRTLSNHSLIKIATLSSSLKKTGDRIEHIHPFKFLECVFDDEELKVCLRNMQGRKWVWKEFVDGLVRSFSEESAHNNVKPHLQAFVDHISIDAKLIQGAVQGRDWDELVSLLIRHVPRKGAVNRYNI